MINKLVSAVILTHNRLNLLKKAVESVSRQTYPNMEVIIVDDASCDGTRQYMEAFVSDQNRILLENKYKYIYIPKEQSKGGNHARNLGIQSAKGTYVAFLDDDDEWFDQKIKKQAEYLDSHGEVGVVSCASVFEYSSGKRTNQDVNWTEDGDWSRKIFSRIPFTTSSMMARRELLIRSGLFDENLHYWQEYELLIRLCQITRIGVVREHLLLYRKNEKDKSRLTNQMDGWEKAVKYVERKHQGLLDELTPMERNAHTMRVLHEGAVRADKCKNIRLKRELLKEIFYRKPTIKNLAKLMLGKPQLRD